MDDSNSSLKKKKNDSKIVIKHDIYGSQFPNFFSNCLDCYFQWQLTSKETWKQMVI